MRSEHGQHVFVHDLVRESIRDRLTAGRAPGAVRQYRGGSRARRTSLRCLLPAQLAWLATQAVPDIAPERAVALLEAAAADATAPSHSRGRRTSPRGRRGAHR